jgi:DNA-binding transcriptional MerR regulator
MTSTGTAAQIANEERLYRIGEVSRLSELKPFVLRYWETEFPMLEPVKSPSGHRMYRQEDVDMVFKIKRLLYDEGFTIAGARRHLRETNGAMGMEPSAHSAQPTHSGTPAGSGGSYSAHGGHPENAGELLSRKMLLDLRDTLRTFLTLLERR